MNPADHLVVLGACRRTAPRPALRAGLRRAALLLLVACTAIGVAALHTVGHATDDVTGIASSAQSVTAVHATPGATVPRIFAADGTGDSGCGGDGCTHHIADADRDRLPTPWWDVCLAVLSVLAGTVLAAGLARQATSAVGTGTTAEPHRSPPDGITRRPVGSTIARLSVLRI